MDIKEIIYKIKGMAILSVIIAHTPLYATSIEGQFISRIYSTIGAIGVPIFLFISGYLFSKKNYTLREFLHKKINTIIIPWFFCASIVYIISCYFGSSEGKINIISYMKFVLGDGSLFYYMSILFLLYIGIFYILENKTYLYIVISLSIISIYLTAIGIFDNINLYLNPFNFAIYFTLGILLKNKLNYIIKFSITNKKNILLMFFIILFITAIKGYGGYVGYMTIPFSIISFLAISSIINNKFIDKLSISQIGKFSYTIYLLHMPIAGVINILCNNIFILNSLKFLFVIEIIKIMINIIFYISDKYKKINCLLRLIGLPVEKIN